MKCSPHIFYMKVCGFLSLFLGEIMEKNVTLHTTLTIKERNLIVTNGIKNVISFDESFVSLQTEGGRICVEGEGLKIESLNPNDGEIRVTGRIDGVYYAEEKRASGLFKFFK